MKLKYTSEPLHEGGSAVPDCGTIHLSEIQPTLAKLSLDLDFTFDLNDYILGSTGKRDYSGDIDLVLDSKYYNGTPGDFVTKLKTKFGTGFVARNGDMVHLKYPIVNYNPAFDERKPRTGFVQVDFNFGDADWERIYHYSPGANSEYKGAHRNLAIAAITSSVQLVNSEDKDGYNRPVQQTRWKFGSKGLLRVNRVGQKDHRTGAWMKKQVDTNIHGPYLTVVDIVNILFPEDNQPDDIDSLETIMAAVKRNYGMVDRERIWKRMAGNFAAWKDGKNFTYPSEIDQYFDIDDK